MFVNLNCRDEQFMNQLRALFFFLLLRVSATAVRFRQGVPGCTQ